MGISMSIAVGMNSAWDTFAEYASPSYFYDTGLKILESLKNGGQFLSRFIENPTTVGSVLPSSQSLAEKIVRHIPENNNQAEQGKHYLEIGPGTGSFTSEIVKRLSSDDELDVVEIDPIFCEILKKKYASYNNVHVHCKSITDWSPEYKYDAIISGLPLNAFTPDEVQIFIDTFKKLAKDEGTVSYFEYAFIPVIKVKVLSKVKNLSEDIKNVFGVNALSGHGQDLTQFQKVLDIKKNFFNNYGIDFETVYLNFPPAHVMHFRIASPKVEN